MAETSSTFLAFPVTKVIGTVVGALGAGRSREYRSATASASDSELQDVV
jgi:hypothetical protein